jgi:hypothetical protein
MQREKYPAGVTTGIEINIGLLYFLSINIRGLQVRRLKQGRFGRTRLRPEIAGGAIIKSGRMALIFSRGKKSA